jgi:flagellar hook-associated protein 2
MSSPITLSGFNNIDFSSIVSALMQVERQPVIQLQAQQTALKGQKGFFGEFTSKLSSLESAVKALYGAGAFHGRTASVSDTTAASATVSSSTPIGSYEIIVDDLARSQVSITNSTHADADTTIVASGGSLVIDGVTVNITGNKTLQGLADAINETANISVTASVVHNNGNYTLSLTAHETGLANSFAITNNLSGGSGVTFDPTNPQDAADARGTVNGVAFSSSTNVIEGALPGGTLTLSKRGPVPIVVTIRGDTESIKNLVKAFQSAYNSVVSFIDDQQKAAGEKNESSIGRDPLVRGLRGQLARVLNTEQSIGGTFTAISQVGLSFARSGQLEFKESEFDAAISTDSASVERLFKGSGATLGVFNSLQATIESYTTTQGLLLTAQERLDNQLTKIADRIAEFERRLAIRREALQKEFTAADLAISQLKNSGSQLSSLTASQSAF